MDPATHTLTAYMLSRAGLNRWCPLATPVILMAANVPDIDYVSLLGGNLAMLEWRRGLTHSLLLVPLMAVLPLAVMTLIARRRMVWRRAYVVAVAGVLSHLALDITGVYGVRLFAPFSNRYFHLEVTAFTDVWMLAVLAGAVVSLVVSRLVASEIGSQATTGRGVAIAALLFVMVWQTERFFLHARAVEVLEARVYDGEAPVRAAALPNSGNPLGWKGLVETEEAYRVYELSLLSEEFNPDAGRVLYKPANAAAMDSARRTGVFERFLGFAEYPCWRVAPAEEPEGATVVQVTDLRFADPGEGRYVAEALVGADGEVIEEHFQFDPPEGGPRFR